jgi:small-conductance mechanosensitive channel/CRP-like cAMP-binding protein
MPRSLLALLLLASLALGAVGLYVHTHGPDPATTPVPPEFAAPPTPSAAPPPGARPHTWFLNTLHEARRDGILLVLAGILFVTTLVHVVSPAARRRIRTSVLCFFAYLVIIPLCGLLSAGVQLEAYGWVRTLAMFCVTLNMTNLAAVLLFDVVLPAIRLPSRPILRDLITGIAYILVTVAVLSRAGVELKGILAGSAVLGAIIGLSIQSTLGDAFGGLILEWEGTLEVGDWIKIGDLMGQVMEIRWRHLRLETHNWETVLLPNSAVTKAQVMVLGKREGQPTQQLRRWLYFYADFRHAPTDVIRAVDAALQGSPIDLVASEPRPNCVLMDLKESAAYYGVRYWLKDLAATDGTDSVMRTRVFFALQRAGIELALPSQAVQVYDDASRARDAGSDRESRVAALRRFDLFAMLNQDELARLAPHLSHAPFARAEVMTRQGAEANFLYLLVRGDARVELALPDDDKRVVARLTAPDYFGEMALLTGERRSASVIAESDCECWRLERSEFKAIVKDRPEIATELSHILASRQQSLQHSRDEGGGRRSLASEQAALLDKITSFFGLTE